MGHKIEQCSGLGYIFLRVFFFVLAVNVYGSSLYSGVEMREIISLCPSKCPPALISSDKVIIECREFVICAHEVRYKITFKIIVNWLAQ